MSDGASTIVQIPAHGHCEICSAAIKRGDRFCASAECKAQHEKNIADKKKSAAKMIAILAGLMLFFTALNQGWI